MDDALRNAKSAIRISEEVDADPSALFESACQLGLEGIIGKNLDTPYRSGRTGDWVNLKCVQSEGFFIVGYEPSTSRGGFSSLLLAAYRGSSLVYVGSVGTGFKERDAAALKTTMGKLPWRPKTPPVAYDGKRAVVWIQPTSTAEIEFRASTADGKLRHAAFKGLRERQDNADVYRIEGGE